MTTINREIKARKVILNLAVSLDGCIADQNGGFDWICGQSDDRADTPRQFDFSRFLQECDVIVMGKKSFDDCGIEHIENYQEKQFLIASSQTYGVQGNVRFVCDDIVQTIAKLKSERGKNIWLFGGARLARDFIKSGLIDEYIIGIIPVILGKGRKLFFDEYPFIRLCLTECTVQDGVAILRYVRRKEEE